MRKWVIVCMGALMLCAAPVASAQTADPKAQPAAKSKSKLDKWSWTPFGRRVFLSISGLAQGGDTSVQRAESFDLYDERGTYESRQAIKTGATMADVGGGVRMKFRGMEYGAGLFWTTFNNRGTAEVSGSLPHPLIYDKPRSYATSLSGLIHKEDIVHVQAYVFIPFVEKVDFSVFAGPSFYSVAQGFATGVTFRDVPPTFDAVELTEVRQGVAKNSTVGFNIGGEVLYDITRNVTAAGLIRFTRAEVDLDVAGTTQSFKLGNAQIGGGLRLRF